jgi:hypothetical protein
MQATAAPFPKPFQRPQSSPYSLPQSRPSVLKREFLSGTDTAVAIAAKTCLYGAGLVLICSAAGAVDICVKCTGPDANYDCVVNGSAADTVTKLYCITALAKVGPHASCAIDRNSVSPCQGERKEFTIPTNADGTFGGTPERNASTSLPGASPDSVPPATAQNPAGEPLSSQTTNDAPPRTMQEVVEKSPVSASLAETQKTAGNAAKSAGTALEKAGAAVGSAAKTSWKCLSSFFSDC